jgi:hypothetical protein
LSGLPRSPRRSLRPRPQTTASACMRSSPPTPTRRLLRTTTRSAE